MAVIAKTKENLKKMPLHEMSNLHIHVQDEKHAE